MEIPTMLIFRITKMYTYPKNLGEIPIGSSLNDLNTTPLLPWLPVMSDKFTNVDRDYIHVRNLQDFIVVITKVCGANNCSNNEKGKLFVEWNLVFPIL